MSPEKRVTSIHHVSLGTDRKTWMLDFSIHHECQLSAATRLMYAIFKKINEYQK